VYSSQNDNGSLFLFRQGGFLAGALAFERRQEFVQLRAKLRQPLAWEVAMGMVPGLEPMSSAVLVP